MSLDAKTLEQLRRSRSIILGIITKNSIEINPIAGKDAIDVTLEGIRSLKSIRTMLQSKLTLVEELREEISDRINPDDSMHEENEIHNDIEMKIREQLWEIEEILTGLAVKEPVETPSHSTNQTTGFKKPKFDHPKVTGKNKTGCHSMTSSYLLWMETIVFQTYRN